MVKSRKLKMTKSRSRKSRMNKNRSRKIRKSIHRKKVGGTLTKFTVKISVDGYPTPTEIPIDTTTTFGQLKPLYLQKIGRKNATVIFRDLTYEKFLDDDVVSDFGIDPTIPIRAFVSER
jgi:hypothetical protein